MKYLFNILVLLVALGLVFSACKKSDENSEHTETIEVSDTTTAQGLTHFLFLTEWFGKAGVYSYNLSDKKYTPVWWHPRENVVMLVYRPDNMPAYFITAGKMGTKGKFPYFSRVKLFRISRDRKETLQVDKVDEGIQFTARWNADNNLELIFTSIDKVTSSYVNQYTKIYDFYGKLIDSRIETFDIEKSGFPYLAPQRNSTVSPSAKYGLSILGDSVFLKTASADSLRLITALGHNLNKIKWTDDEKFLIISTLDMNNLTVKTKKPETSELLIYSPVSDTLIKFSGAGVKNFFTSGDLLIFDDGFGNNSRINIFNLNDLEIIDMVQTKEGCGLVLILQM